MDNRGAFRLNGFTDLCDVVVPIGDASGSGVLYSVGRAYGYEILFELGLSWNDGSRRAGSGPCSLRRSPRTLNPGVHVCLVVYADVDKVVPPLQRPGESL